MDFHEDEESGKSRKLVTLAIVIMLITVIYAVIVKNDREYPVPLSIDSDNDGILDVYEVGSQDNSWAMAGGDVNGLRRQNTTLPETEDPNFLWGYNFTNSEIMTVPLFYHDGVVLGTYSESSTTSTIYYFTENVGHIYWSYTINNAEVIEIQIDDSTESLVIFYEDHSDEQGSTSTKLMVRDFYNPSNNETALYWPTLPGIQDSNYTITLEGSNAFLDSNQYSSHPIVDDGMIYFVCQGSDPSSQLLIALDISDPEYYLDQDLNTKGKPRMEFEIQLNGAPNNFGIYEGFIWKIVLGANDFLYLGINTEIEGNEGGKIFAFNLDNINEYSTYPSGQNTFADPFCDMAYFAGTSESTSHVIVLFNQTLVSFNTTLTTLYSRDITNDFSNQYFVPAGYATLGALNASIGSDNSTIVVFGGHFPNAPAQQGYSPFKLKEILWYNVTYQSNFTYIDNSTIDCLVSLDEPMLATNKFVTTIDGVYAIKKNEYDVEYISRFNSTDQQSTGTEYIIIQDAHGFILANGKIIINTYVYNPTTSSYNPSLKCYGGYTTDPTDSDSDNDGIDDGTVDANSNGIFEASEWGEIYNTTNGTTGGYGTDPGRKDTDGDQLSDGSL